jgi:dipeptidase D
MSHSETFFEPAAVYNHFKEITKRPHPSGGQEGITGNEDPVREYVIQQAEQIDNVEIVFYNKDATEPGQRVIVLRRPGSGDHADNAPVIIQGHLDMVYNPEEMAFPLNLVIDSNHDGDGKWIKATDQNDKDCTLGADNGIGVATALAALADEKLKDYPIECLFTLQEETDMSGAQKCDVSHMKGNYLLNLDSETLNLITFGSAGGNSTAYKGSLNRCQLPEGYTTRKVSITDLQGGHSGLEINKGRLNAVKILAQALIRINNRMTNIKSCGYGIDSHDFLLYDIYRNDVKKSNAIPAGAEAIIAVREDEAHKFKIDFHAFCKTLKNQNSPEEDQFSYKTSKIEPIGQVLDPSATDALLGIIQQIPHGVIKMIPGVPDVVETSSNLYEVDVKEKDVTIYTSNRSSSHDSLLALNDMQAAICRCFGFQVETGLESYPSWQPDTGSELLHKTKTIYDDMFQGDYEATVMHAGLECGVLVQQFKQVNGVDLEAISIGPTIAKPHTPNECLQIEDQNGKQTISIFYTAVSRIIQDIFTKS